MTTHIEWTRGDDGSAGMTWNPTTGCDRVSAGCDNCYALTMAARLKGMGQAKYQCDGDPHTSGPGFGLTVHEDTLALPLKWRKPRRVFVNSMSDLFHTDVPDEFIARVWAVMAATPQHTYQILTKRHARMRSWVNRWYAGEIAEPYAVKPAPGFPGYLVTTHGEVLGKRSDTRGGLSEDVGEQGHRRVTMHREGSPHSGERVLVHRLVLEAFVRPARAGEQGCHRNGDPSDNRLSNLNWGTQELNWADRIRHGNGRSWSKLSADDVTTIRRRCVEGESAYRVAQEYPISDTQIRNVVRGDQWASSQPASVTRKPCRAVLESVWLGVSVEDQKRADLRIPALLETPAVVRFLSCEPLLGPVDLRRWTLDWDEDQQDYLCQAHGLQDCSQLPECRGLQWCIVGGESGAKARPMHPDWARSLRDQCQAAGVSYFFKQWGEWAPSGAVGIGSTDRSHSIIVGPPVDDHGCGSELTRVGKKAAGRELDGRTWDEFPVVTP